MSTAVAASIEPGLVVANRYVLDRPVNRNSRATTWLGMDRQDSDARVIVKLFRQRHDRAASEQHALDLHLQVRRGKRWRGLPCLLDQGWEDGRRFVVFERGLGEPLAARSAESLSRLPLEGRFHLARTLVHAVFSLHEAGFLHLGISPENVLIDPDGRGASLECWGYMVPIHCHANAIPGATDFGPSVAPYASAERLAGETADARDDVFAIACIAYEIIGGFHPLRGQLAHKAAQLGWRPPPLHSLNSAQHAMMMKALALERNLRNVHLGELAEALAIRSAASPQSPPSQPTSSTGVRTFRMAMTGATAAGIALSFGAWQLLVADQPTTWTESVQTILPPASLAPPRPPNVKPATVAASPEDAARVAAELNRRAIFGTGRRSRTKVVNEMIIPVGASRTQQSAISGPAVRSADPT